MPMLAIGFPVFKDSACKGPAFILTEDPPSSLSLALLGGAFRVVLRSLTDEFGFGPARAWKGTATVSYVPANPPVYFELKNDGGCAAASSQPSSGDFLIALTDVPTPRDGVGPLTIG